MELGYLTVLFLVPYVCFVNAETESLVLNIAQTVVVNQAATYTCSCEGTGNDPTLVWSIKKNDGTVVLDGDNLNTQITAGGSPSTDGSLTSSVTFTVLQAYFTNHSLWCGAIDTGNQLATLQIYTAIQGSDQTASLGGACSNNVACNTANAACVSNICTCNNNYYDTNGVSTAGGSCSQQSGLGGTCTAGIDQSCSTSNARCSSSSPYVCECTTGYTQSGSTCTLNSASLGGSCAGGVTCNTANADCVSNICRCNNNYYDTNGDSTLGGSCSLQVGLGGTCTAGIDQSCYTSNARCSSFPYVCECTTGYTQSGTTCISSTAGIGQSCINPSRSCPTNAVCSGGTCQCNSGYVYSNSLQYCISGSAGIGQSCINPSRSCPTNAVCSGGTCQCNSGYVYSNSLQYCISGSAAYGAACINPVRTCPTNAGCTGGTCQCNNGYIYSSQVEYCVSNTALVGDTCVSPTRTCITNAACNGATCQCSTGYYQASVSSCILPIVGQSCTVSVGCATSSGSTTATPTCTNSNCVCPSGYYSTSGVCYIRASLGDSCNTASSTPCSDSNAQCTGSPTTCQCNSGYTNSNNVCSQSTSTSCPSGTNNAATVTGTANPLAPSVTVGQTCYVVNLQSTQVMQCSDSKGASSLQSARWLKLPNYDQVVISTGRFINGDIANPNLTVSNTESSDAGNYICQLCYGLNYTQCTNSQGVQLIVNGTSISSVVASVSDSTPLRYSSVTFQCTTSPANVATSYKWFLGSTQVSTLSTYNISTIGTSQAGTYKCEASNSYGTVSSTDSLSVDVQYAPEANGGTITTAGDFDNGDIDITCNMNANPAVTTYYFYDAQNNSLQTSSSNTYTVTSSLGYQTYSCRAVNSRGLSGPQYLEVEQESDPPNTGAATEDTGIGTGTIAAIVLGIIFLLLLIIIIIVCCCSYGWCRKKEKVEPQVIIKKPIAKPYIPRNIVSASSAVSRKDVGVMMNGHHDVSVSTDFEEPRYATPRYHLKPASNGGPIISIYDNGYDQPKPHQLPALDTQYLYTDNEPKKHKKKKRRRRREDVSPRRHHYEPEPEPDVRYAETMPASDEDLVVIPGKHQNYFE